MSITVENGKTYLIKHSRKGVFSMRIDSQCDTWINGVIVSRETSTKAATLVRLKMGSSLFGGRL